MDEKWMLIDALHFTKTVPWYTPDMTFVLRVVNQRNIELDIAYVGTLDNLLETADLKGLDLYHLVNKDHVTGWGGNDFITLWIAFIPKEER